MVCGNGESMKNSILIVDDSPFISKVLVDILQDEYEVMSAANGVEALSIAKEKKPELILLDVEMPDMDGFEVLKRLKKDDDMARIPVIFLTGMVSPKYEEKGFICGAVDYITKPYNPTIVKLRVKTHMELAIYRRRIEEQMDCDTLTDIYNRRGFERKFKVDLEEAVNNKSELSLMIADIDHFKMINDTYGHLHGDYVLKKLGGVFKDALENTNGYAARYGGEEFVIVLPDGKAAAYDVIESIRQRIKELRLPNKNSSVSEYVTVSIGGCTIIPDNIYVDDSMFKCADMMLYKSKENGRNRVTWYDK